MTDGPSTRETILHAAREVFGDVGFENATFQEVATRADVTRPAVNHYFRSKESLYNAVFDTTEGGIVRMAIEEAQSEATFQERISRFMIAALRTNSSDPSYARFMTSSIFDSVRNPKFVERARGQLEEIRGFLQASLATAVKDGEIDPRIDVEATGEMLLALIWGLGVYAGFVGTPQQLESAIEQFLKLVEGSLWTQPA